jgi:hypothetical protein
MVKREGVDLITELSEARSAMRKLQKMYVEEEWDEGHPDDGGDGYWVALKHGWKWAGDPIGVLHTIHTDTRSDAYREYVLPCNCPECAHVNTATESEELIECAIDQLVEADLSTAAAVFESEVDVSKAKKAATFERWLKEAGIPFEKTVKKETWLMGTDVIIEYYIEPLKHWGSATQVFFSLRLPGGTSTLRRHTSEKVWGGHGKVRFTNLNSALHWTRMSREMYSHTDKSLEQTLDALKTEDENPYKRAVLQFKALAASRGFKEKVVGDYAYTRTRSPVAPMIKLLSARQNKLQVFQTGIGRFEVDLK